MEQRFARCHRLTKTDEFSSVFGFRRALRGKILMLHYQPREMAPDATSRLGLVVGKKQLKRAVDRNRVKRVLREVFRRQRSRLPCCDLVVRLMSKPQAAALAMLAEEFEGLLRKLPRDKPGRTPPATTPPRSP